MARDKNSRKGKQHRPRLVLANPLNLLNKHTQMDVDQLRDLGIAYRAAFQTLLTAPDEQSWATVASTCNVAIVLCEMGYGREYEADFRAALEGLQRSKERAPKHNSWALDAAAINTVSESLDMHDQQIELCTIAEISAALNEVRRRVNAGIAYEYNPQGMAA